MIFGGDEEIDELKLQQYDDMMMAQMEQQAQKIMNNPAEIEEQNLEQEDEDNTNN